MAMGTLTLTPQQARARSGLRLVLLDAARAGSPSSNYDDLFRQASDALQALYELGEGDLPNADKIRSAIRDVAGDALDGPAIERLVQRALSEAGRVSWERSHPTSPQDPPRLPSTEPLNASRTRGEQVLDQILEQVCLSARREQALRAGQPPTASSSRGDVVHTVQVPSASVSRGPSQSVALDLRGVPGPNVTAKALTKIRLEHPELSYDAAFVQACELVRLAKQRGEVLT